jgi:hypothetical protein
MSRRPFCDADVVESKVIDAHYFRIKLIDRLFTPEPDE